MGPPIHDLHAALAAPDPLVLEGFHAVKHALRFGVALDVLVTPDPAALARLTRALAPDLSDAMATARPVDRAALRTVAPRLASPALGVARRPDVAPPRAWSPRAPVLALQSPRHAGNTGAVVRVAAATGAAGVVLVDGPSPWDRAVVRAAAGLVVAVPVVRVADVAQLVALAHTVSREVVALHPDGGTRPVPPPQDRAAPVLLFGTERAGLDAAALAAADRRWTLGMRRGVSSLNLATAVAATCYLAGAPWTGD